MNKYRQQQQEEEELEFRQRKLAADESCRMKMRMEKKTAESNNDDSSGTNPNSTFSSLHKQPQPHESKGVGSEGRSPRPGFDPRTDDKLLYKTAARGSRLMPMPLTNEKKAVNWQLACFLANEYLTSRTLLGRPWPPQNSNPKCRQEDNDKSKPKSASLNDDENESRNEKERLYYTITDFLRVGDVDLPGIVNPSQLAAYLGLK